MRVLYKNKKVYYNTRKYSTIINKPSLDGHIIEGNISLDTLNLYDKPRVKKLVEATSQIRLVTIMPADPEPNVTYYVGPDERNLYDVVLVDDAKQQIRMGTTQFGQYKSGPGVNIMIDNSININTDGVSTYVDSEGNLASSLDGEALPAFDGATSSTDGTKGLVPKPMAGEQDYALMGDATWVSLLDIAYPIGSLFFSQDGTDPADIVGGTWAALPKGYFLWSDSDGGLGIIEQGLPNLTGYFLATPKMNTSSSHSGAFYNITCTNLNVSSFV